MFKEHHMNTTLHRPNIKLNFSRLWDTIINQRGKAFGIMILGALLAFELFNFSTTDFALSDVLGDLEFAGMRWATILAIAFCGIDFAGIARLFTPEQGADEPAEVWYLFGAWVLAAGMNASLTWWGVSVAIATHTSQGSAVIANSTIQTVVPIFVAVMVWVIRILIIGTFSVAGERLFTQDRTRSYRAPQHQNTPAPRPSTGYRPAPMSASSSYNNSQQHRPTLTPASQLRPAPKPHQSYNNNPSGYQSGGARQSSFVEYEYEDER
jgi:hypothetical protein